MAPFEITSPPRSRVQSELGKTRARAEDPGSREDKISYGYIEAVAEKGMQVKVTELQTGKTIANGAFLPVINDLEDIFLRWGQIRVGMLVRFFYRGKHGARKPLVEIIGGEGANMLTKEERQNEVETRAYKIFGGGLTMMGG